MREMQAGRIKRRRTKGGNEGVKEEGTDEIIEQDGGIYNVDSMHKSGKQQIPSHTPQTDLFCQHKKMKCQHQEIEPSRQMLT